MSPCPAHDDECHHYHINAAGESECDCGANLGIVTWKTEELWHDACPKCQWRAGPERFTYPRWDPPTTCGSCGASMKA